MSDRGDWESVKDVREAIVRIRRYLRGIGYRRFLADTKTQDAIVRNLEIIGEAAKSISSDFKKTHPDVDWRGMAGMRDGLIHQYFGVNLDIVWSVLQDKLPGLRVQIEAILKATRRR
jgi:uncharacterized protein with HEPN domain